MSDRLAVFNKGRIEQVGAPAEVYERPATPLRGRLRRDLEPAAAATSPNAIVGSRRARSRSGPRRSGWREPDGGRRTGRDDSATGHRPERRLSRPGHPVRRRARRRHRPRGHPAEPVDVVDRGARHGGQGRPPRVGTTTRAPHRGWDIEWRRMTMKPSGSWRWPRRRRSWSVRVRARAEARRSRPRPQRRSAARPRARHRAPRRARPRARRPPRAGRQQASVGPGEGALNLIAWTGYVVGGTGGEQVQGYDWVTPFETATGCKVTVKVGLDSGNMVQLMKTGQYDGVSASGDATLRLIYGGDVAPVNFDLIPNYKDVFDGPQEPVLQHGQRRRLWRAARPRRQRPDVRPDGRHDRPRQLERRVRRQFAVQGQGHRLQLRDLHRRRGART